MNRFDMSATHPIRDVDADKTNFIRIASDVILGPDVRIFSFVNLYGCQIGRAPRSAPSSRFNVAR